MIGFWFSNINITIRSWIYCQFWIQWKWLKLININLQYKKEFEWNVCQTRLLFDILIVAMHENVFVIFCFLLLHYNEKKIIETISCRGSPGILRTFTLRTFTFINVKNRKNILKFICKNCFHYILSVSSIEVMHNCTK